MSQTSTIQEESTEVVYDTEVKCGFTSPKSAPQKQPDPEAMAIFRRVSEKHHSLWVSLAKP